MSTEASANRPVDSDDEVYENASSHLPPYQDNNEDIINNLIEQHEGLDLEDKCPDSLTEPGSNQSIENEEHRRAHEATLTPEQLNENRQKASEFKATGNTQFKNEEYENSVQSYTAGLDICPLSFTEDRSVLFGNRAAAYIQLTNKTLAIQDCTDSLALNPNYLKVLLRRAKLYEETDKLDESLQDFKDLLAVDGSSAEAAQALVRIPPKIDERNEKLKTEMLGKLKDLGNMILKPFGLSTNNFQMKQDPATGSYSVNFQQNAGP